jgi:hypothetical protein
MAYLLWQKLIEHWTSRGTSSRIGLSQFADLDGA